MLARIRPRLTYANVVSTIALFVVLGGGAYATIDRKIGTKDLRKNAVTTKKIKGQAVRAGKLAANSVRTPKIFDGAVVTAKLGDQAVTTEKIADLAVGTLKLANNAVTSDKLTDNAVTANKLANNAVTTTKIADNAVTNEKIQEVSGGRIADLSIAGVKILGGAITTDKLADNSVNSAKIINGEVRRADVSISEVTAVGNVANNAAETLDLTCPAGSLVIGGGGGINQTEAQTPPNAYVTGSTPVTPTIWRVRVRNQSGAQQPLFGRAWCLNP